MVTKGLSPKKHISSRFVRSKHIYSLVKFILPWLLLFILITISISFIASTVFKVAATPCSKTNLQPCSDMVIKALESFHGIHPLKLNQKTIHSAVVSAGPDIQGIESKFLPPRTLSITYSDIIPFAAIQTASQSAATIVAQNGSILDISQNIDPEVTLITFPDFTSQPIGKVISNPAVVFTLQLIDHLNESGIMFTSVIINSPQRIQFGLNDGRTAVFSNQSDILAQVTSLQLILSESTINPSLPVVDVRFQKPVLKPSI